MAAEDELFGKAARPEQLSFFGEGESRFQGPQQRFTPDPEAIRGRLRALLETARGARAMPWSERDSTMWQTVFPNMANWLPEDEARQLRLEFAIEIERLKAAA